MSRALVYKAESSEHRDYSPAESIEQENRVQSSLSDPPVPGFSIPTVKIISIHIPIFNEMTGQKGLARAKALTRTS